MWYNFPNAYYNRTRWYAAREDAREESPLRLHATVRQVGAYYFRCALSTTAMSQTGDTEITVEQIDVTKDTGDPVFRAESGRASMTFLFPTTREHDVIVHTVRSKERGGMKELLDHICTEYDCELIRFSTPLSDQLGNRLHGFEKVVETVPNGPMAGSKWECLDGRWEVE